MRLKKDEIEEFFKLHKALIFYINKKKNIIKGITSVSELKGDIAEKVVKLRDVIIKNPLLIDEFVTENPFNFKDDELENIKSWKRGIYGEFLVMSYDSEHTIFYNSHTKRCYGVLSLYNQLKDMLGPYLPIIVDAWIIPFNGVIVYDGLISPYNVTLGKNIRDTFKAEYEESILKYGVTTSFDEFPKKTVTDEDLLKFYLKSNRNRERFSDEIYKLRKQSPRMDAIYHQKQGECYSRMLRKKLKEVNAKGFFAIIDDTIIASALTIVELDRIVSDVIPKEKIEWLFKFKI